MARMFPEHIPRRWREEPRLAGERRVYTALSAQLSDDYSVLWRVPLYDDEAERNPDAEADFVILHSSFGLMILEVKGGRIERDGPRWYSRDRYGKRNSTKDPYQQATQAKHVLVGQLRRMRRFRNRRLAGGHGVVFPDSVHSGSSPLGPNAPLAITAFSAAMGELGGFVERLMREASQREGTGFGPEGVREVEAHLAPRFKLRHPLQATFEADDAEILLLTEEQFNVLDLVGRESRVLVTGGAGTGKTLLAIELARRLSERGVRTLLTTASSELAEWISGLCKNRRNELLVAPLSAIDTQLIRIAVREEMISVEKAASLDKVRFGKPMAERWFWITDTVPALKFDAVVVDEAQDLLEQHWTALSLSMNDPDHGAMYAFCDEAQLDDAVEVTNLSADPPYRLSPLQERLPSRFVEVTLIDNLRNTQEIFALARALYMVPGLKPGDYRCRGPKGEEVEFIEASEWSDVRRKLKGLVRRLIVDEQVAAHDMAILYCAGFADDGGRRLPWDDPAETRRADLSSPGADELPFWPLPGDPLEAGLTVVPATRFRGMERRVVIIVGSPATHREAYIGLTRPRVYLALIGTAEDLDSWRSQSQGAVAETEEPA